MRNNYNPFSFRESTKAEQMTNSMQILHRLSRYVEKFLLGYLEKGSKILLGFSGGNDSLTLLHLLWNLPFTLHLAHLDHGWRSASAEEAEQLKKLAKEMQIPFFMERSSLGKCSEEQARNLRFSFFTRLYQENEYKALLLAHHRDDQAETILKRLFEGAHLTSLSGMKSAQVREGMLILRPLLAIPKEQLMKCELKGIQDETNEDPRFLRGRMRSSLLPCLSRLFGKEIKNSLIRLGQYSEELQEFFATYSYSIVRGPFGMLLEELPKEKALLRFVLHEVLKTEELHFSESLLSSLIEQLAKKKPNCHFHPRVYLDRGRLFLLKKPFLAIWKAKWVDKGEKPQPGGWQQVWEGRILLSVPAAEGYRWIEPSLRSEAIDKRWAAKKVPALFRNFLPLLSDHKSIIGEFLSGQKPAKECKFCISMELFSTKKSDFQAFEVVGDKIFPRD